MTGRPYVLHGALGSPYSMKMRALLRYRRLPFIWTQGLGAHALASRLRVPVIPVLEYPGGTLRNDSTDLIADLDARHPERRVAPDDAARAMLAILIEDFADEWLTKAMYFYRWGAPASARRQSATWLCHDFLMSGGAASPLTQPAQFEQRQVERLDRVGCASVSVPCIERAAREFLAVLERHAAASLFFFGSRPSAAEFALYGQLSQLVLDEVPLAMLRRDAPFTYRWLWHLEDLSGIDGRWDEAQTPLAGALEPLLTLVGATHGKLLLANEAAAARGADRVRLQILGLPFEQPTNRYLLKCLNTLRTAYRAMPTTARSSLRPLLAATGCLQALDQDLREPLSTRPTLAVPSKPPRVVKPKGR